MRVFLNYSDNAYLVQRRFGAWCAKWPGGFDRVISLDPSCIDAEFVAQHWHILSQKRGAGYWLWKPYIILRQLRAMDNGDMLVYCDAGSFFTAPVARILTALDQIQQDIYSFELPYREKQYTNKLALHILAPGNTAIPQSNQIASTFHFIRKTDFSVQFYETFLRYACEERLITDSGTQHGFEDPTFIDHRHDQSIHSILYKLHGLKPVSNATQWGGPIAAHFEKLPAHWNLGQAHTRPNGQVYRVNPETPKMPEVLYSCRSRNPVRSYLEYRILRAGIAATRAVLRRASTPDR